jgi:hypothetical protein
LIVSFVEQRKTVVEATRHNSPGVIVELWSTLDVGSRLILACVMVVVVSLEGEGMTSARVVLDWPIFVGEQAQQILVLVRI